MTYRGHVRDGQITLVPPARLPEGAVVEVEVVDGGDAVSPVWGKLLDLAGTVKSLPPDAARNHDHYLYGTPKQ